MVDINDCHEYVYILDFNANEIIEIGIKDEDLNLNTEELLSKYGFNIDDCNVMYSGYQLKLKHININE